MPEAFTIDQIYIDAYRRKAITAYNRLEVSPRTADFDRSLKAEIRDPLWMLTRQWQFGELKGEDAASAVTTEISRKHSIMESILFPGNHQITYNDNIPLETVVERQLPAADLSMATRLCIHFIRLMKARGLFSTADMLKLRLKYGLSYTIYENDIPAQQLLLGVEGSAFDGMKILLDIRTPQGAGNAFTEWINAEGMPADFITLSVDFANWFSRLYCVPVDGENAWLPSNLEYQFRMATSPTTPSQQILNASQYMGGHLDWYSFDLESNITLPSAENRPIDADAPLKDLSFIPTPVTFPGIPNPRFWMMEDSKTDFGKLNTSPTGLLHLLFAEFGLVYSNDWFILPYPVNSNTLVEINSIIVTDVFGQRILIRPSGMGAESSWQRWALFHHSDINNKINSHLLYVAPVVQRTLEGDPIEQVNFLRDEMANLVWGVETTVPSQSGKGFPGTEMAVKKNPFVPLSPPDDSEEEPGDKPKIKYVLGNMPPNHWTPFIPVQLEGSDSEIRLQRAKLPGTKGPFGIILKEKPAPYYVNEEEIGRSGVIIQQSWQLARWYNGKTYLWLGRYKQNGKGEGWSNLAFDQVVDI